MLAPMLTHPFRGTCYVTRAARLHDDRYRKERQQMNGKGIEQRLTRGPQRLLVENLGLIAADSEGFDHVENL